MDQGPGRPLRSLDDEDRDAARATRRGQLGRAGGIGILRRRLRRWLPPSLAGSLVDPGRPGAVALVLVVLAAAVIAGFGVWTSRPRPQPVSALPAVSLGQEHSAPGQADNPPDGGGPAPPAQAGPLVVSVVGKVVRPGLVRVPDGSRVADAIAAAGGTLRGVDLSALNLARRIGDGEQLAIGVAPPPEAQAAAAPAPEASTGASPPSGSDGSSGGGAATGTGAKVNLNQATVEQLDALPGVGPVTAKKILDWRTKNGRFSRIEQLREIDGIGERRFAQLREVTTV